MTRRYHIQHTDNRTTRTMVNGRPKLQWVSINRVKVRLLGGVVFTHKAELSEWKAKELVEQMQAAAVHERSFLEMRRNPHFEPADTTLFVTKSHSGRAGGGRYSYTVHASTTSELEAWGKRLCGSFHPMGYGTIINPVATFADSDGRDVYQLTATRWGSCD
jgi:hypothetical protein